MRMDLLCSWAHYMCFGNCYVTSQQLQKLPNFQFISTYQHPDMLFGGHCFELVSNFVV